MNACYERLSPQQCPEGLHADWLVDSEHAHTCPWCRIAELGTAHSNAVNLIAGLECDLSAATARVAELETERHTTNEALSEAVQALRVQRDRIAELEAKPPKVKKCAVCGTTEAAVYYNFRKQNICQPCGTQPMGVANTAPRQPEDPDESIPRFSVSEIARWQARQVEDPHDSPLHHDYAESRDLPIPRQTTGRCPKGHTFEDCTCGGGS